MDEIKSILEKQVFDHEDRKEILKDPRLKIMFMIAGLMKTTPQQLLSIENSLRIWEQRYNEGLIESWEFEIYKKEHSGGKCDVCQKPWKKKEVKIDIQKKDSEEKEQIVIAYHYQPNCTCYMRCYFCNRFLIIETKSKLTYCRYCSGVLRNGKVKYPGCWQVTREKKQTPDGQWITGKKMRNCTGAMHLKAEGHGEYTVYECSQCGYILKKRIIV